MDNSTRIDEITFEAVDKLADLAKELIDAKTPEDRRILVGNNEKKPTVREGGVVVWSVENTTPYAPYVEYGVQGKSYNYHKPKWEIFHKGVGAGMYARTNIELIEKWEEIIIEAFDALIEELNQWTS